MRIPAHSPNNKMAECVVCGLILKFEEADYEDAIAPGVETSCGCRFCKDCWIQRLVITRLEDSLECENCKNTICFFSLNNTSHMVPTRKQFQSVTTRKRRKSTISGSRSTTTTPTRKQFQSVTTRKRRKSTISGSCRSTAPRKRSTKTTTTTTTTPVLPPQTPPPTITSPAFVDNPLDDPDPEVPDDTIVEPTVTVTVVDLLTDAEYMQGLVDFIKRMGHSKVPSTNSLHSFCKEIRLGKRKLPDDQRLVLDTIGFDWDYDSDENDNHNHDDNGAGEKWLWLSDEDYLQELVNFLREHNTNKIPTKQAGLYRFARQLRLGHKDITEEQRELLEIFGFDFGNNNITITQSYEVMYPQLLEFHDTHGHCNVPQDHGSLYRFVTDIRRQRLSITESQKTQLTELSFHFTYRKHTKFSERVQQLLDYKSTHGHCSVPYADANRSLAEWVKDIRRGHMKVTKAQRKVLDSVGFNWETRKNRFNREWTERLERLKAYKAKYGDCRVPWQWEEDRQLSEWCCTQRKLYNKGKLRDDRKRRLEQVGFVWSNKRTVTNGCPSAHDEVQHAVEHDERMFESDTVRM